MPCKVGFLRHRNAGDLRECERAPRRQFILADAGNAGVRRRRAVRNPGVHGGQKRSHRETIIGRIRPVLRHGADRLRVCAVLRSRQKINSRIRGRRCVLLAVRRRVYERGGAPPVFVRPVGVENFRDSLGLDRVRQDPVRHAGVGFRLVGEWKDVGRIKNIEQRVPVTRGLREAVIETPAARSRHMRPKAVEHLSPLLIRVEAVIQKRAQEPAALRRSETNRAFGLAALLHVRHVIPDRGRAQAHQRRVLCLIHDFVDAPRLEPRVVLGVRAVRAEPPFDAGGKRRPM